jgi:TetR/AcrR family transcriptional regulator
MAQAEPRTPRAERTRAAILAAAEALFAERGFDGTRLEDVAERVGIRRASIVYHFRDKPALYDAVLAEVFGGLLGPTEAALLGPGSLGERIEAAVSAWVDYVGARPSLARLLLREVADARPERAPALLPHLRPFTALAERVSAASEAAPGPEPAIDPAHVASTIAGATVFFVAAMPVLVPDLEFDPTSREQLEAHRREVLRITRRLVGHPARAVARAGGRPRGGGKDGHG